ncbi:MAG TPA: cation-translocating P-type ATPase [Acetobacteraceae bacterium]|jgi:heavy metal translocating P-type ATPase|nr:cation-translocating P-type ATPase [Acetobacteraceae bacterium]
MTSIALDAPLSAPLIARTERFTLAVQLTIALAAGCLLAVAVGWRFLIPGDAQLADLVAGAAAVLVAVPVLAAAWESLRHPSLHGITDRLIAVAMIAAWASGDLMTAAVLPIVMILGHVLEERSLIGSQEAIRALSRLTDEGARLLAPDGSVSVVSASRLRECDVIEVRAGDRIAADGTIRRGRASLDMASLTGESVPVEVAEGDPALAGALNTDGYLEIVLTRVGHETTLGRIIALMREAESAKPPVTRLLDRHAGRYLALVLTIAAGTWFASADTEAMLAVLVASCPCALVLAAPSTAIAAIAVAARHGILIKGTGFLERLADVSCVVFDKTGTITTGALRVIAVEPAEGIEPDLPPYLAASLGAASSHPVSRAAADLVPVAERATFDDIRETGGLGLTASLRGERVAFGRPELFARLGMMIPPPPAHDGPIAGVALGARFLGWLLFADQPRPEAVSSLAELRTLGLQRQILLTGDRGSVAGRVAGQVGIDEVSAEATPEQKMHRVRAEISAGHVPLVVGDGINDSLALKAGAVGIAMGAQGTDVALASADLVLMTSDLRRLGTCIRLSRRCRRTIHVNVAMGLGWTGMLVALAAVGALGTEGAIVAALLHNASTLAGLANAGRLLRFDEMNAELIPSRHSS